VVLEVAPNYQENPDGLKYIYVPSSTGKLVPLSSFAHYEHSNTALSVNHQGIVPAITLSFNLAQGASLGPAVEHIQQAMLQLGVPNTVHASFQGTAQAFKDSLQDQPIWILAALAAVYIVLGILYESFIHPVTILSTIPSAGIGALLALQLMKMDLSIIAIIGIILLIGIVKKNAILMIDFAVQVEREENTPPDQAIYPRGPDAFPPDYDDHHGRDVRGFAAGARHWSRLGNSQATRHHHRWRPDSQPDAHALHDAGRVHLYGPAASLAARFVPPPDSDTRARALRRLILTNALSF